ncbi:MAG: sigma-70 family RNA polymerase sigma factor [Pseudomonadota bacterium]
MDVHRYLPDLLPRLTAFARVLLNDYDAANDLVQEAASRALAASRVPVDAPAYRAWLFRIVRNAALDDLRRRRSSPISVEPGADAAWPAIWNSDDAWIAKITVEQGLALLSREHREIIALIDIAGFSYGEAADLLQIPAGTVMSRITRARGMLLAAISKNTVRPLKSHHGR